VLLPELILVAARSSLTAFKSTSLNEGQQGLSGLGLDHALAIPRA